MHNSNSPRKPTFSPTRIGAYLECAVRYRFIYLDKIGKFYLHSSPELSFGSSLHQALQQFHAAGAIATPDELRESLNTSWIRAGYESEQQDRDHLALATQIVETYHSDYNRTKAGVVETIATEKTISCDMGVFKLSGRVDRIDRYQDGSLEVIDYKSGRTEVSPEDIRDSLAMSCYQLILNDLYPETVVRGTIYCLRTGESSSYSMSPEELKSFRQTVVDTVELVLSAEWSTIYPIEKEICKECEFASRCRAYWRQQARLEQAGEL